MHGTVERDDGSAGEYEVPMILIYPNDGGNDVGVVDLPYTRSLQRGDFTATVDEWEPNQFALDVTDRYLFENGFTYAGVKWDKAVTEYFGSWAPDGGEAHSHLRKIMIANRLKKLFKRLNKSFKILFNHTDALISQCLFILSQ